MNTRRRQVTLFVAVSAACLPLSSNLVHARVGDAPIVGPAAQFSANGRSHVPDLVGRKLSSFGGTRANNNANWINLDFNADNWGDPTHWSTNAVPNDATDSANFPLLPDQIEFNTTTLNASFQVGTFTYNSPFPYLLLQPTSGGPFNLTMNSGLISATGGVFEAPYTNTVFVDSGMLVEAQLIGSGGITKSGTGHAFLTGNNTFTGGITINGGIVSVEADTALGDPAGAVNLSNGATLRSFGPLASTRSVVMGTGGGIFQTYDVTNFSGVISGTGDLTKVVATAAPLTLSGVNTYSGRTRVYDQGIIQVGGSILNSQNIDVLGQLEIGVAAAGGTDRISDTARINSYGGNVFLVAGNATTTESVGSLNLERGHTEIRVRGNPARGGTLTFNDMERNNRSTAFIAGRGLGATGLTPASAVFLTNNGTLPLVGGGGALGSTNISIIPFMGGNATVSTANNDTVGDSGLVTYTAAAGFRPLVASEYATDLGTAAATDNVKIAGVAAAQASAKTVNALVFSSPGAAQASITGAGAITVTSGLIATNDASGPGAAISNPVNFGAAEGVVMRLPGAGDITFNGVISGSNGVTFAASPGKASQFLLATYLNNTASTYTGQTTVTGGLVAFSGNVGSGVNSAFGNSTSAVIVAPGANNFEEGGLIANTPGQTFSRPVTFRMLNQQGVGSTLSLGELGTFAGTGVIWAGDIVMEGGVVILNGDAVGANGLPGPGMHINGNVSGSGGFLDLVGFSQIVRIAGNNTYTGATNIFSGLFQAASNTAFGTGTVVFDSDEDVPTGAIEAFGGPRTLSNPMMIPVTTSANPDTLSKAIITGAQPLTWTGLVNLGGNVVAELNITNTADTTISGVISNGGFAKTGPGLLIVSGANQYTGLTLVGLPPLGANPAVPGGRMRITHAQALGALGQTQVDTGAALEVTGGINVASELLFIKGTGVGGTGALRALAGDNTWGEIIVLNGSAADGSSIGVDTGAILRATAGFALSTTVTDAVLTKVGGGSLLALNVRSPGLNVQAGTVGILPTTVANTPASTSSVRQLTIAGGPLAPTARLDLGNNSMIFDYTGTTPITDIRLFIGKGYNGGNWAGNGITSSKAATSPNPFGPEAEAGKTAIGYAEASSLGLTSFQGLPVDATAIIMKYTYAGDTNLNGQVDITDLGSLATNWQTAGDWIKGDFDYNGFIDITDLGQLATNWQAGVGAPLGQDFNTALASVGLSSVPEPSALCILGGLPVLCLARRVSRRVRRDVVNPHTSASM